VLALAGGCGTAPPDAPGEPAAAADVPAPPAVEPVPAELPEVVASVNAFAITSDELEQAVRSAEIQAGQALPAQFRDSVYRAVLDRLVAFHLLLQESETRGIVAEDAAVEARIDTIRSGFPNEEALEAQLDSWNTSLPVLRGEARRDLLVERVLESAVFAGIEIDPESVRAFYEQHPAQFTERGGVRARHILIGVSPDASEPDRAEARERARALRLDAEEGADFEALAREHSDDPGSAANGGDLGLVVEGQTVSAFEAALFALEPGELSDVVETPFGFHVIQMVERRDDRVVPFEEARGPIGDLLLQQEQQARAAAFMEELKTQYNVRILI
jgi:peptidyl-prolyl cis-trans isomerase C